MAKKISNVKKEELTSVKINFEGKLPDKLVEELEKKYFKIKLKKIPKELCKVCDFNLYYDENCSRRIAITDSNTATDVVISWMCPKCFSEFDMDDNLIQLMTKKQLGET